VTTAGCCGQRGGGGDWNERVISPHFQGGGAEVRWPPSPPDSVAWRKSTDLTPIKRRSATQSMRCLAQNARPWGKATQTTQSVARRRAAVTIPTRLMRQPRDATGGWVGGPANARGPSTLQADREATQRPTRRKQRAALCQIAFIAGSPSRQAQSEKNLRRNGVYPFPRAPPQRADNHRQKPVCFGVFWRERDFCKPPWGSDR